MRRISLVVLVTASAMACITPRKSVSNIDGKVLLLTQDGRYDGINISFRLLVTAEAGSFAFDGRLIPGHHVYFRDARDCDDGRKLARNVEDYVFDAVTDLDVVRVEPGFYYGADLKFEAFKKAGPACIDATFSFHSGLGSRTEDEGLPLRLHLMREPG